MRLIINILFVMPLVSLATEKLPCDEDYARNARIESHKRLDDWRHLATKCRESQRYYVAGAVIAKETARYDESFAYLNEGLQKKGDYTVSLMYNLADLHLTVGQTEKAEPIADELIRIAPEVVGGYWKKAQVLMRRGAFPEAITVLLRSPDGATAEETAQTKASLCIAYHMNNQHLESAKAMQEALKISKDALTNVFAVSAAARSLAQLGYGEAAQDLLDKHLTVTPESIKIEEYRNAASYVQSVRVQESKP